MDADNLKVLDNILEDYAEEMQIDLLNLLAYNSVNSEAEEDAPFGIKINEALNYVLNISAKMGLKAKNYHGYVGIVDYGEKSDPADMIGILSHIDIVPFGEGWIHDPSGEIKDGIIYGRGTTDDKGPMIACLYAMKALKESQLPLGKTIRHIIGTDEETGFRGISEYLSHNQPPSEGFTPDAEFPLIYAEKGIAHFGLIYGLQGHSMPLFEIKGGSAQNIIPNCAEATISVELINYDICKKAFDSFTQKDNLSLIIENNLLRIKATGKAAHASTPEKGLNAIDLLLEFITQLSLNKDQRIDLIRTIYQMVGKDMDGSGLGIKSKDEFGELTMALTMIDVSSKQASFSLDVRFPVTTKGEELKARINEKIKLHGLEINEWHAKDSLYVPLDNPLIKKLMKVYQEITGDKESLPLAIGGGTYARVMNNFVGFGPNFPGRPSLCHQAEESLSADDLLLLSKIYAHALYDLAK